MSIVYSATATGEPVLQTTCPSDGDARTAASINVGLQGLGDDVSRLANGGRKTASFDRVYRPFVYSPPDGLTYFWTRISTTTSPIAGYAQAAFSAPVGNEHQLVGDIDPPHGATITAAGVWLLGASGHSAMPMVKPFFELYEIDLVTGTLLAIGNVTDGSSTTAAYEVQHFVQRTGLSRTVDRTSKGYSVRLTGESGTNAKVGLLEFGVVLSFTSNVQDWGG